jgi:hypothetical protein
MYGAISVVTAELVKRPWPAGGDVLTLQIVYEGACTQVWPISPEALDVLSQQFTALAQQLREMKDV